MLAKQNESMLNKSAPAPYLDDDDKDYDGDKTNKGTITIHRSQRHHGDPLWCQNGET